MRESSPLENGAMGAEQSRLSEVLSLAVHELRTPLATAAGYLRILLRQEAGAITDAQRIMVEAAAKSCARMGMLVAEMSELGLLEAGDVITPTASFDLSALVVELSCATHEGVGRGIRLEARAVEPVLVTGDRRRLSAALGALLQAALRERCLPGVIVAECFTLSDISQTWAIVTIGDEAITRSLVNAVRETPAYFDESSEGLGLALLVGRRVIESHGGALWSSPLGSPRAGAVLRLPTAA